MGKRLIIKGVNYADNAIDVDWAVVPLIGSAVDVRYSYSTLYAPPQSRIEKLSNTNTRYHTYVCDVSSYVGRKIRISTVCGYADGVLYGVFVSSTSSQISGMLSQGFSYESLAVVYNGVMYILGLTEEQNNVFITREYTVPAGANYLIFSCKESALGDDEEPKVLVEF